MDISRIHPLPPPSTPERAPWEDIALVIQKLSEVAELLKGLPVTVPTPPPVEVPGVPPPPEIPPPPTVIVQPPIVTIPSPFAVSQDLGIASGGDNSTLRDDTRHWQDNVLRGCLLRIWKGDEAYETVVLSNTYNTVTFSPLPTGVKVTRGDKWFLRSVMPLLPQSAVSKLDRYSGADTEYQTVVSWTVSDSKFGILKEISMVSDTYSSTYFRLTIGGEVKFEDKQIQATLTLPYPDLVLAPGQQVLLEAKSDGTSIIVDGSISGAEVG